MAVIDNLMEDAATVQYLAAQIRQWETPATASAWTTGAR